MDIHDYGKWTKVTKEGDVFLKESLLIMSNLNCETKWHKGHIILKLKPPVLSIKYLKNGKLHRADGKPALVDYGEIRWVENGKCTKIAYEGSKEYSQFIKKYK